MKYINKVITILIIFVITLITIAPNIQADNDTLDYYMNTYFKIGNPTEDAVNAIKEQLKTQNKDKYNEIESNFKKWDGQKIAPDQYIKNIENAFNTAISGSNINKTEDKNLIMCYTYIYGHKKIQKQGEKTKDENKNKTDDDLLSEIKRIYAVSINADLEKLYDAKEEIKPLLELFKDKKGENYKSAKDYLEKIENKYKEKQEPAKKELADEENGKKNNKDAVLGEATSTTDHNLDEVLNEAAGFLKKGDKSKISTEGLQSASDTVYNILLALGIVGTVIAGTYLAIKFMFDGVEGQAKVKEALVPYIVGCVVIFGAFIIWKLAIIVLRGIA